ncbi:MAG: hypothetical protein V4587_02520 [Acidobacteriota bacterium]
MEVSSRALFTQLHGLLFGAFFLLAIFAVVVELWRTLYEIEPRTLTRAGRSLEHYYLIATVLLGWAAVLTGAYIVYPWYRAIPPAGAASLAQYPQALLKSSPATAGWHSLGMEWKEHVAWFAPIVMTMVAYVSIQYGFSIRKHPHLRNALLVFVLVAFFAAGVAGYFGAEIDDHAPVQGGVIYHLLQEAR